MLAALDLYVTALEPWPRVPFLGRALHAVALQLLRSADATLAQEVHTGDGPRPFSVCGPFVGDDERLAPRLVPATSYRLRISALTAPTAAALARALEPERRPVELALDEVIVRLERVEATTDTYEGLRDRYFPTGPVRRTIELTFLTPTSFHSGGKDVPLPLPELVFGSLLERWNAYAPFTLSPGVRDFARECVGIAHYDLKAWVVNVAGGRHAGFVGRCGYRVLRYDPYWTRALCLLADFAFYSGVGIKTGMGMGACRRSDLDRPVPDRAGEQA